MEAGRVVNNREEEDFDFGVDDIEEYYGDDKNSEDNKPEHSLLKDTAPNIRSLKSKFSNGMAILEILADMIKTASSYSLKIYSGSTDIGHFRKHKGAFMTIFSTIKPMFGKLVIDKIDRIEEAYEKYIKLYTNDPKDKNRKKLLVIAKYYENKINHAMMVGKISFEVERVGRGSVARNKILS